MKELNKSKAMHDPNELSLFLAALQVAASLFARQKITVPISLQSLGHYLTAAKSSAISFNILDVRAGDYLRVCTFWFLVLTFLKINKHTTNNYQGLYERTQL